MLTAVDAGILREDERDRIYRDEEGVWCADITLKQVVFERGK